MNKINKSIIKSSVDKVMKELKYRIKDNIIYVRFEAFGDIVQDKTAISIGGKMRDVDDIVSDLMMDHQLVVHPDDYSWYTEEIEELGFVEDWLTEGVSKALIIHKFLEECK